MNEKMVKWMNAGMEIWSIHSIEFSFYYLNEWMNEWMHELITGIMNELMKD